MSKRRMIRIQTQPVWARCVYTAWIGPETKEYHNQEELFRGIAQFIAEHPYYPIRFLNERGHIVEGVTR